MPELWTPGAVGPSLDDFVGRLTKQIERYTATHASERSEVQVHLADGARVTLLSISPEPGYGFVTLAVYPEDDREPEELIVPVNSIRRIELGPAEAERARFGFALPEAKDERADAAGTEPAA
jgi:hypothetical protein